MKKLLFAIVGAAAFAASAADPAVGDNIDVLGFENFDFTNPNTTNGVVGVGDDGLAGQTKWSCAGDDASTVKAYGGDNAAAPTGISFPAPFEGAGDNYLALDTNGSELQRAIPAEGQSDAGTYVDTLVQFTPSESAPGEGDLTGAKLAIWLGVVENVTNLYVQGGYLVGPESDGDVSIDTAATQAYKLTNIVVEAGQWYRLTVKSVVLDDDGLRKVSGFQVYVDGTLAASDAAVCDANAVSFYESISGQPGVLDGVVGLLNAKTIIPTCAGITAGPTLASVGFKGTGAIDDFVVTTVAPEFTPAGGDDYKVSIDGSDVVITPQDGDLTALQAAIVAGGGTLDVTDVDAVNTALAAPIGTTGIPSWQAIFLGLPPTEAGLESFKIDSISFDEDGNVVVELPDDVDPKTGRGVDITIKLKSADTPNAESWADVESASGTTFAPFAPGSTDTKKFYKVVVEFAGSSASAGQD